MSDAPNPFAGLTPEQRQLLTCALAGNHPERLASERMPVLRMLARADHSRSYRAPVDMQALEDAVEDLAGAALGCRPTFATPWTDAANATPVEDVRAVIDAQARAEEPPLYDVDALDEEPSHSFVSALRNVTWDADRTHSVGGGSTRHWVRDDFLPALHAAGYEIRRRRDG